jgi:hypothetical protein
MLLISLKGLLDTFRCSKTENFMWIPLRLSILLSSKSNSYNWFSIIFLGRDFI